MSVDSVYSVLMILLLILVGVVVRHFRIIEEEMISKLTKLALSVTVPSLLFFNSYNKFTANFFKDAGFSLILPLGILLITYFSGDLVARLFKLKDRGLFAVMFGLSNAVFIGLPICKTVFGEEAVSYVTMFFFCNTLIFWTLGRAGIARDGGAKAKFGVDTVKKVFSMPMLGFIFGTILALSGIPLPAFVLNAASSVGNMTTPLTMMLTGSIIYGTFKKGFKMPPKASFLACLGRFILSPALTFAACYFLLPHGGIIGKVFLLESGMPVMTQSLLLARTYNANDELGAMTISLTTILCLLSVPLLTMLANYL